MLFLSKKKTKKNILFPHLICSEFCRRLSEMKWRRTYKMRIRGVHLRTYQMGRRRLSKMVMGGVHLHLFF